MIMEIGRREGGSGKEGGNRWSFVGTDELQKTRGHAIF
jgi:hypothetical protein